MADFPITAASVVFSGVSGSQKLRGIAGETLTPGMPLYFKASDQRLWKADADVTEAEATVVGMCLSVSAAGQPVWYAVIDPEFQHGTNAGAGGVAIYLSDTAGGLKPGADLAPGDFPNVLMVTYGDTATLAALNCGALFAPEAVS